MDLEDPVTVLEYIYANHEISINEKYALLPILAKEMMPLISIPKFANFLSNQAVEAVTSEAQHEISNEVWNRHDFKGSWVWECSVS